MSEQTIQPIQPVMGWGIELQMAECSSCHWRYLLPVDQPIQPCPHCYQKTLTPFTGATSADQQPYLPELILPYQVSSHALDAAIASFAAGIPFAPEGLKPEKLRQQLAEVYLPMWLVDAEVSACWQAEAGFNYEVVSHQEFYDQNRSGWKTREIKEPRVRWENRVGRLKRSYQNVPAPALDDAAQMEQQLGSFKHDSARPYTAELVTHAAMRLPDHTPEEAWSEAAAAFQGAATAECQQACAADHLRQFRWTADYASLNWTLLLQPIYSTSYLDDQGHPQPVLINGQSGQISGVRRASTKRAARTGRIILAVSLVVFVLGLLLGFASAQIEPALSNLAVFGLLLGAGGILAAALPYLIAWDFNRKQAFLKSAGEEKRPAKR